MTEPALAAARARLADHPEDPDLHLRLARALFAAGRRSEGWATVDRSASSIGLDAARRLHHALGGARFDRAGRAFLESPTTSRPARALVGPSPRGVPGLLFRSPDGWHLTVGGATEPPPLIAPVPHATWLGARRIALASEHGIATAHLDPQSGIAETTPALRSTREIEGILALDAGHVVVALKRSPTRDLEVLDLSSGAMFSLPTLSPRLELAAKHRDVGFVCFGDGVQPSELRFVWPDGRWRTRMAHEVPLRGVASTASGSVSIDRSGQILWWRGDPPRPFAAGDASALAPLARTRLDLCPLPPSTDGPRLGLCDGRSAWIVDRGGVRHFLPGVCALSERGFAHRDDVWFAGALRDGWHWLSAATGGLPPEARLPLALASEAERGALRAVAGPDEFALRVRQVPGVGSAEVGAQG